MSLTHAFVAHSFTDDDSIHVNRILEYLTQITKLNSQFSWVHAREAEPSDLADKVIRLANDANMLIAICSRKEMVFRESSARQSKINRKNLILPSSKCDWATSDWIVQEIGMAIGRSWKIIILLEDGVRRPGGLQGNLEYISFARDFPERSYGSLAEMISSQTSISSVDLLESALHASSGQVVDLPVPVDNAEVELTILPASSMTLEELEHGHLMAYIRKETDLISQYDEVFRASDAGASDENRAIWDIRNEWLRYVFQDEVDLTKVKELVTRYPNNYKIRNYHARLLSSTGELDAAAAEYSCAADLAVDPLKKIKLCVDAATQFLKVKNMEFARDSLAHARKILQNNHSDEAEILIVNVLASMFESEDVLLRSALGERQLQINPDDHDARFKLAYTYGDANQPSLSLYQYKRIPETKRGDWVWNNMGVAYSSIQAKGKSVEYYEKAISLGSSLAVNNRAKLLRDAGFLSQAEDSCKQELSSAKNDFGSDFSALTETVASVVSQRADEEKKEADVLDRTRSTSTHLRELGAALIADDVMSWSGAWVTEQFEMDISLSSGSLVGKATYSRPTNALRRALIPDDKVVIVQVDFVAKTYGRAAHGAAHTKPDLTSNLLNSGGATKIYLVMSIDGQAIQVIENLGGESFNFYVMSRKHVP